MGRVLHGSATTTEAVRRDIQSSEENVRVLAKRHGINQKTVAKWKKRDSVADLPTGPEDAKSTVLNLDEEAMIVWGWAISSRRSRMQEPSPSPIS